MNENRSIPLSNLTVYTLWIAVALALIGGWLCVATSHPDAALMLGLTACVGSVIAGTATVRLFELRTHRLIRAMHGIETPSADLHAIP